MRALTANAFGSFLIGILNRALYASGGGSTIFKLIAVATICLQIPLRWQCGHVHSELRQSAISNSSFHTENIKLISPSKSSAIILSYSLIISFEFQLIEGRSNFRFLWFLDCREPKIRYKLDWFKLHYKYIITYKWRRYLLLRLDCVSRELCTIFFCVFELISALASSFSIFFFVERINMRGIASRQTPRERFLFEFILNFISVSFERYDFESQRWELLKPMPTASSGLSLVVAHGSIYAIGVLVETCGDENAPTSVVEKYNHKLNKWTSVNRMIKPRSAAACVSMNDAIYVMGGATKINSSETATVDKMIKWRRNGRW